MTTTYTHYTYNIYQKALQAWLDANIISYANDLVQTLMAHELVSWDDISNLYEPVVRDDFQSDEEYKEALDNQEPREIMQWFIVTELAYNKFKSVGYPVFQFKELYLYGRTGCGQALVLDFYYAPDTIKTVLDL